MHAMRRIETTRPERTEKFRSSERLSSCQGLESLHSLRPSFSDWLKEAEAETMASSQGLAKFRIHCRRVWLAQSSLLQDGTKVCAILLQKLHFYEEQWQRAFDKGYDLGTLRLPSSTKGDVTRSFDSVLSVALVGDRTILTRTAIPSL